MTMQRTEGPHAHLALEPRFHLRSRECFSGSIKQDVRRMVAGSGPQISLEELRVFFGINKKRCEETGRCQLMPDFT